MNTDDYYTESDIKLLTGSVSHSEFIRDNARVIKIGKRRLYYREDVNDILEKRYKSENEVVFFEMAKRAIKNHNIDLSEWIGLQDALNVCHLSRERLYVISSVRNGKKVRAIMFNGFWMFNRYDLEKLQKKS